MAHRFNMPVTCNKGSSNALKFKPKIDIDQYFGLEVVPRANVETGYSIFKNEERKFEVESSLGPFSWENVKIVEDMLTVSIHLEHEPKEEGQGIVSRKMERIYLLPEICDPKTVEGKCTLSAATVTVQKVSLSERKPVKIHFMYEK